MLSLLNVLQNVQEIPNEYALQDVMLTIDANWYPGQKPTENINTLLEVFLIMTFFALQNRFSETFFQPYFSFFFRSFSTN